MDPDRWKQIDDLFEAALQYESSKRKSFLDEVCRGDDELRQEIESLLSQAGKSDGILGNPTCTLRGSETEAAVIGRYRMLQKIGEGGMGEVWLVEQREPIRRRVSLKLVKAGLNTREVMARFESERQALALMDHPAIAKVFDAGSTPQGVPYFVMEYVAGIPVTAYCDQHRLSTRERLELFVHVCEGVQHAHQKAIIHRDLKPSNILVTEVDGRPAPKIIDFGVAKALTQRLTTETMFTRVGAMIGTPEYMSPEQALSSGEDIDTRTDVYSLGVILYELLAGERPLDFKKVGFDEFLRKLREEEPPKPSTRIRTQDHATMAELARNRQTEPPVLCRQMRGDLDSITLKALEKDRSRRYGSPSELAADIGRYLRHEAVLAVPPSVAYRARKFARRYRAALATAFAFALVLILATVISIGQSIRATKQRNRADAEAAIAQAVNDFLQNDLLAQASAANQSGPSAQPDPDLKVRTALDRAAARITGNFGRQPEVEASLRTTIGQTYIDLGLYSQARTHLERALDLWHRVGGPTNPSALRAMTRLGRADYLQGKNAEAEVLLNQSLNSQRQLLGAAHRDTLATMNALAEVYGVQGKYAQAEELDSQTVEIRRRMSHSDDPSLLYSMNNLAVVYQQEGKYAQAETLFSQTLEIKRRVLGPEHPSTLNSMHNLADVFESQGRYAQAEALDSQTLEIRRRVLGPEHPNTLTAMNTLGIIYKEEGEYVKAEALDSQTLEIRRRTLGPEHPNTLSSMNNLAEVYLKRGKYTEAESLLGQTLELKRRVLGSEHPSTMNSMNNLAIVYGSQGKYAQAEALFIKTLGIGRRVRGPENDFTLDVLSELASMYQRQRKYSLAEAHAAEALAGRRHRLGSEHMDTMASAADLALAYQSQGKFAASEPLAREAFEFRRRNQPDGWQRFLAESLLGASLAGEKRYPEAEPLLVEGYQGMLARKDRIEAPKQYQLGPVHEWLVQFYKALGKPAPVAASRNRRRQSPAGI